MERKLILYALPIFAIAVLVDFLIDTINKTNRYRISDAITSLSAGFLGTAVGLLTIGFVGFFYNGLFSWYHIFTITDSIWFWVLAAFIYDFLYYWMHRAHHRINILWALHATHHNSEYFNFTTALRQCSFGFIFTWLFFLPMAFLGFTYEQFLFGAGLSTLYGFFTHTEYVKYVPYIERILIGPSSHRVHHGTNARYLDKNYGSILSIWDHFFGTYAFETREELVHFGTITPIKSFNPLWINLSPPWLLFKDAFLCKSWRDKFIVWVKHTGWRPTDLAPPCGTQKNEQVAQAYEKFDQPIPPRELSYVILNFLLAAASTTHLMISSKYHSTPLTTIFIAMLLLLLLSNSFFLEQKKFRFHFEVMRLFATGAFAFIAYEIGVTLIDQYFLQVLCVISLIEVALCINFYLLVTAYNKKLTR